jgi:hypothetical protein
MQSVFVLAEENKQYPKKEPGQGRPLRGGVTTRPERGGRGRNWGRTNEKAVPLGSPAANKDRGTSSDWVEYRTCRICCKKGHIQRDCPDIPVSRPKEAAYAAMAAVGELDEADEEAEYDACFMMASSGKREDRVSDKIFFVDIEVLLDNQASQSVFKNATMLYGVKDIIPYYLGGIDSGASAGLKVTRAGSLRDLSGVDGEIGVATSAAANVLSKTRLVDAGHEVSYDTENDVYHLKGDSHNHVFSRREFQNGKKSAHYSCVMSSNFVVTAAQNKLRYTKREIEGATAARELMAKLGHSSSQATVDILNMGVMNCT